MSLLLMLLQCGAFVVIPMATFGFGVRRILQLDEKYHRISSAGLIGFISFEASTIGMIIDPRSGNIDFSELIFTSGIIGIATFLLVLFFLPIAMEIFRICKK
ncbi:MAG TPA: hypothetical protein VNA23_05675 [Anaerolineales bacterium]|nr:hypothetical protein [Anaerolineales bacterium]